ncbi:MAG: hypothetical protein U0441_14415 [Polyangiaceae bacterium]
MDPFVQATRRFCAGAAMFWKLGKRPILRAVAPASQTADLVRALRWEEAQPHCRRPLVIVTEAFPGEVPYFEAVTARIAEAYALLCEAAKTRGLTLSELHIPPSSEPVVTAVRTAENAASALPPHLDGLTVALVPSAVAQPGAFSDRMSALVRAAAALRDPDRRVRWIVHEAPGGPLRTVLGTGVDFAFDEEALFTWWRDRTARGGGTPEDTKRRAAVLDAVDALREGDPESALKTLEAALPEVAEMLAALPAPEGREADCATTRVPVAMPRKVLPFARETGEKSAHEPSKRAPHPPDVTRPLAVRVPSPVLPFQPGCPTPDLFAGGAEIEPGDTPSVEFQGAGEDAARR